MTAERPSENAATTDAGWSRAHRILVRSGVLGPAVVAAVGYVDPGNFATNFTAGARYGYLLVWVVVAASLVGMLVQYLSAKLGVVTGSSLPELVRNSAPRGVVAGMWAQAQIVAVATDLGELLGGALALNLLFGWPLLVGVIVIGGLGLVLLGLSRRGTRRFEYAILAMLLIVLVGLVVDLAHTRTAPAGLLAGLVPRFQGDGSVVLAAGILGATVMPHAIYLHSGLPQSEPRDALPTGLRRVLARHRRNVLISLGLAGALNVAMLVIAVGVGPAAAAAGGDLAAIYRTMADVAGPVAAFGFAIALLAAALASTSAGTLAGQVIADGFLRRHISPILLRCVTLVPAVALALAGTNATRALILTQLVLSAGLPFALVPLLWFTARRRHMGEHANGPVVTVLAGAVTLAVVTLNVVLIPALF